MTWLFIRFYLCVLVVLFLAWYIHATVLKRRADAEMARVIVTAHRGGARLVASELNAARPEDREQVLQNLRRQFDYPVEVIAQTGVFQAERNGIDGVCRDERNDGFFLNITE